MPSQSDRVVNVRVSATDDGATATLSKIGKAVEENLGEGAKSGGNGSVLGQLKGGFGRGSALTQSLKALQGGGVVLGLSLVGRELDAFVGKAAELRRELNDGSKSAGQVAEELAKSIPVFGALIDAGRKFRSLVDGTADDAARLERENALTKVLDGQAEAFARIKKVRVETEEAVQRERDKRAVIGMVDPGRSLELLKQERERLTRQIDQENQKARDDAAARNRPKLQEALKLREEAESRYGAAVAATHAAAAQLRDQSRRVSDSKNGEYAKLNLRLDFKGYQLAKQAQDDAEREKLARESAYSQLARINASEANESVGSNNDLLQERLKTNEKDAADILRSTQVERARLALVGEAEITEIRTKAAEERLRFLGKDTQAELLLLRSAYELEKKQRQLKLNEELYDAEHGGKRSPDEVATQFYKAASERGAAFRQGMDLAVKGGLRRQFLDIVNGLVADVSGFSGKDMIDSLLRKMGLKGIKVDRGENERFPLPSSTAPYGGDTLGGSGAGARLAEDLMIRAQQPAVRAAEQTARNTAQIQKAIEDGFDKFLAFVQTIGVSDFPGGSSVGGDF